VRDALEGLIKMGKGLKETALPEIVNVVEKLAEGNLSFWEKKLRCLWMRYKPYFRKTILFGRYYRKIKPDYGLKCLRLEYRVKLFNVFDSFP
jgi:hypothetical protein